MITTNKQSNIDLNISRHFEKNGTGIHFDSDGETVGAGYLYQEYDKLRQWYIQYAAAHSQEQENKT